MNVDQQVEKLCLDLNIKFNKTDIQDWGIIHSNATRVEEFISYFMNSYLDEVQQWHIFELILASYNDAVLDDLINEKQTSRFLEVVNKSNANKKLDIIKDYWRKIYNEEEFPVGKLL